jgi:transcriptional regulator with XRE-family HTH domain
MKITKHIQQVREGPESQKATTIADRIKYARIYVNDNQQNFADKLGISQSYLSNIEKGTATPTADLMQSIHKLTGWPYEWLYEGDPDQDIDEKANCMLLKSIINVRLEMLNQKQLTFIREFIEIYIKNHERK